MRCFGEMLRLGERLSERLGRQFAERLNEGTGWVKGLVRG